MSFDAHKNFAKATVSIGYNAAAVSIILTTGQGVRFPAVPFNATWWNSSDYPDPADDPLREIVRVTAIATDTLTITRAQESTTANAHNITGKTYKLVAGVTAKALTDIEARLSEVDVDYAATITTDTSIGSTFEISPLTGALTLANPINPINGQVVTWIIEQDSTGGRVVTLGNKFVLPSSASNPLAWSTLPNKVDVLAAKYRESIDKWWVVSFVFGYPNT